MEAVEKLPSKKLTNLQLELLKVFNYELSDEELKEIKHLIGNFFAEKAIKEMDRLWDEKGWTNETMKEWANERMRTPYKKAK